MEDITELIECLKHHGENEDGGLQGSSSVPLFTSAEKTNGERFLKHSCSDSDVDRFNGIMPQISNSSELGDMDTDMLSLESILNSSILDSFTLPEDRSSELPWDSTTSSLISDVLKGSDENNSGVKGDEAFGTLPPRAQHAHKQPSLLTRGGETTGVLHCTSSNRDPFYLSDVDTFNIINSSLSGSVSYCKVKGHLTGVQRDCDSTVCASEMRDQGAEVGSLSNSASTMTDTKKPRKQKSVHLCLKSDGNQMDLVHLQGEDKGSLEDSTKWRVSCDFGNKLVKENVVPDSHRSQSFVPLGRGLFGNPLGPDSSIIPFAVATEFPDQNYNNLLHHRQGDPRETNFLVCGKIDLAQGTAIPIYDYTPPLREKRNKKLNINWHQLKVRTFEFGEHVRDMCWTRPPGVHDPTHFLLAAAGSDISIISWNTEREVFNLLLRDCKVQDDTIRSLACGQGVVALGGFSNAVVLHDLQRLCQSSTVQVPVEPLMKCMLSDVVSCVTWQSENSVCCSTDCGRVVLFDSRAGYLPVMDHVSNKVGLYCHSFLKTVSYNALLGFAEGIIEQVDFRYPSQPVVKLQDGSVSDVSDIHLSSDDSHVLVVGNRGFSLYQLHSQVYTLECYGGQGESPSCIDYTIGGNFIPNTKMYGLVDSHGFLAVGDHL